MKQRRIRVMLVDDHAIVREGYRSLLNKQPDIEVIGEASDASAAYRLCQDTLPDVIILDLSMPGQGGLDAIVRLRQRVSDAEILIFSMHQNPAFAFQAVRAGAKGYVTKSSDPSVLIHAVYEVYGHQLSLSPDIAQALALSQFAGGRAALSELTVREFEIFRMLCEARTTEEIADLLHISPKTVSNSHYQIKKKLGVSGDIELVHLALDWNVVDLLRKST